MSTSSPNDHTTQQSAQQPEQPTPDHYERYQWEAASRPAAGASPRPTNADDARPGDVSYMWGAPSQMIGGADDAGRVGEEDDEPATRRDPREERASSSVSRPATRSGPLSTPVRSGPLTGPVSVGRKRPSRFVLAVGGCLVAMATIIALCAVSLGVVTALAAVSRPATASATRTLHVTGAPTLELTISAASVNIIGDSTDTNTVTATMTASVKATSYDSARSIVQAIKLTTSQSGNTITINLSDTNGVDLQAFLVRNVTLDITTPTHTSVSGSLQAGSLASDDLTGALNLTSDAGAVDLRRMTFTGASTLRLSAGGLAFDGALAQGATVDANVNAGSVVCTLPSQTGARLNASASSGSVTVVGWNANVSQNGADASTIADVGAHPTGSLTIRVNAGSVVVTLA